MSDHIDEELPPATSATADTSSLPTTTDLLHNGADAEPDRFPTSDTTALAGKRRLSISGTGIVMDETIDNNSAQSIDGTASSMPSTGRRGSRAINVDFGATQLHLHRTGSFVVHVDSPDARDGDEYQDDDGDFSDNGDRTDIGRERAFSSGSRRSSLGSRGGSGARRRRDSAHSHHSQRSRRSRRGSQERNFYNSNDNNGNEEDEELDSNDEVDAYLASQGVDPDALFGRNSGGGVRQGDPHTGIGATSTFASSAATTITGRGSADGGNADMATEMFQERLDRIERALLGGIEASQVRGNNGANHNNNNSANVGMSGADRFDDRLRASTRQFEQQTRDREQIDDSHGQVAPGDYNDEEDGSEILRSGVEDDLASPVMRSSAAPTQTPDQVRINSDTNDTAGTDLPFSPSILPPPSAPRVNRSPETTRGSVWAASNNKNTNNNNNINPQKHQPVFTPATSFVSSDNTNDDQLQNWRVVNSMLQQAGFNAVPLLYGGQGEAPLPDGRAVLQVVRDLLAEYERRGRVIQDTVVGMDTNRERQESATRQLQALQASNRKLQQQYEAALGRARELEQDQQEQRRGGDASVRSLRAENEALKQRLAHSENRVRAKETIAARLHEKLDEVVGKQKENSARTSETFRQLHRRAPRQTSVNDQQTLQAMGSLEEHREQLESELDFSRAEITRLSNSLVARDNLIERLKRHAGVAPDADLAGAYGSWQTGAAVGGGTGEASGSAVLVLEQIRQSERQQQATKMDLAQRETALVGKVATLERQITKVYEIKSELEDSVESLKLELSSRPSKQDWNESQKRIRLLESQVEAAIELVEEEEGLENGTQRSNLDSTNGVMFINNSRMNTRGRERDGHALKQRVQKRGAALQREGVDNHRLKDTRALMRNDRLNHVLGLNRFRGLSRDAVVELLLGVCRELDLTNVELVVPAVIRLKESVKDLHSLKRFATEVVSLVDTRRPNSKNDSSKNNSNSEHSPVFRALDRVTAELKRWDGEVNRIGQLERLRDALAIQVKRSRECWKKKRQGNGSGNALLTEFDSNNSIGGGRITDEDIVEQMRELVAMETAVMTTRDAFRAADDQVKQHPDLLISRIVKHFQHLFGVRNMEGMFPKLNELYVFASEMTNFLKVLRPMLGLSPSASVNTVLITIQDALQTPQLSVLDSSVNAHESTARTPDTRHRQQQGVIGGGGGGRPSFAQELLANDAPVSAPEWA